MGESHLAPRLLPGNALLARLRLAPTSALSSPTLVYPRNHTKKRRGVNNPVLPLFVRFRASKPPCCPLASAGPNAIRGQPLPIITIHCHAYFQPCFVDKCTLSFK